MHACIQTQTIKLLLWWSWYLFKYALSGCLYSPHVRVQSDQPVAGFCQLWDGHTTMLTDIFSHRFQLAHSDVDEFATVINHTSEVATGLKVLHSLNDILWGQQIKSILLMTMASCGGNKKYLARGKQKAFCILWMTTSCGGNKEHLALSEQHPAGATKSILHSLNNNDVLWGQQT